MKLTNLIRNVLLVSVLLYSRTGFAQTASSGQVTVPQNEPNGKAIMAYYNAFEKKDWNVLQPYLADGFTFSSPLDDHINVKVFKERCWPNAYKIKRFDLDKFVVSGDEAFVICNGWTTDGKLFRNGDYFKLKDGKIKEYECFFGPGINYPNSGK
jgi:SnoaL-like domain